MKLFNNKEINNKENLQTILSELFVPISYSCSQAIDTMIDELSNNSECDFSMTFAEHLSGILEERKTDTYSKAKIFYNSKLKLDSVLDCIHNKISD